MWINIISLFHAHNIIYQKLKVIVLIINAKYFDAIKKSIVYKQKINICLTSLYQAFSSRIVAIEIILFYKI
ncbi:hypothetical protein BpHYR1_042632 [Brachionus plicatilis]|uniref:Uncharacterized protein n=1 Tax=Brachionus plicatilis TaxID=10195 RepID=A0A3M7T7Z4_BRAPC|nr:hypothetical protein BpHYR1_042632 [Brachionus plicatilis]